MNNTSNFPELPCACANLRRAARAVTHLYNQELKPCGIELTQFTLLMALEITDETAQGSLGRLLAMDSTTLTRSLDPLIKRGWINVKQGNDRRQKLLSLTPAGHLKLEQSRPYWEHAQVKLRKKLPRSTWSKMGDMLTELMFASADPSRG